MFNPQLLLLLINDVVIVCRRIRLFCLKANCHLSEVTCRVILFRSQQFAMLHKAHTVFDLKASNVSLSKQENKMPIRKAFSSVKTHFLVTFVPRTCMFTGGITKASSTLFNILRHIYRLGRAKLTQNFFFFHLLCLQMSKK